MAKKISGITIEIDGNTKPLQQALKDLNSEIKNVDKEIKNVDKALQLDPGNAEQVARKLELLEEKAELADKKVTSLKKAQAEMDATGVDKASKEYQNLTTEIAKAEGEFKKITTQIQSTNRAFNEVSSGSKQLETYFKVTGKSADDLVDLLGARLVDAIKSGSAQAKDYSYALKKISEELTGSSKNVDALKKALNSVDEGGIDKVKKSISEISSASNKAKTNVSGLGAEFDTLKQKASGIDTELKQINASLKLDPSSIELCAQKQDLLSQAVNNSEQRLAVLQSRMREFNSGNLDLGEEEFRALQREIVNTETALNGYKTNLTDLENAQNRLNTYFTATGTSARDFSNVLGSELVTKIEKGQASSQELAVALDKIGQSAIANKGDLDQFKSTLDSIDSGVNLSGVKSELDSLGSKSNETKGEVDELGNTLKNLGDDVKTGNLMEAGEALEPLSEGLKSVGAGALEASNSVQDATNRMKVGLGETAQEAQKSTETVKEVFGHGYGDSIDSVSEKFVYLKQVLGDMVSESDMGPLLEQFITLEDNGMDFNETVRASEQLMHSFGIKSQEAMDLLTVGMQNGLNRTDELGDNLTEYSGRWGEAGMEASKYFSLLEAGTNNGAYNLDKVGDYLNEFLTSLSDGRLEQNIGSFSQGTQDIFNAYKEGGATAEQVLNACIGDMQNMTSETDRAALASTIWSSLGEDNAMGMILALGNVEDKYKGIGGAANQAAEDNSNSVQTMQNKWVLFQQSLAPLGEKIAEVANKIMDVLMPVINSISDAFSALPGPVQDFIVVFGGIAAVITPLIAIIGGVVAAFGALAGAIGIAAAPLLAIIAGIAAAIAALIVVISNWGNICNFFSGLWDGFCKGISDGWNNMCTGLGEWWDTTWSNITGFFDGIGAGIHESWDSFCTGFTQTFGTAWDNCKTAFSQTSQNIQDGWNQFSQTCGETTENLKTTVSDKWENLKTNLQNTQDNIKTNLSDAWNNIKTTSSDTWGNISNNIQDKANNIRDNLGNTWNNIRNTFNDTWNNLTKTCGDTWENIKRTVGDGIERLKGMFNFHWELPKIKLPHFKISGSFSLNPPRVPSIGIDWYAKGGILTKPTIFGSNGSSLLGGGEAGAEAVLPIEKLKDYIREELNSSEIIKLLTKIANNQNPVTQVILDTGTLVGEISPSIDRQLGAAQKYRGRQ